jgi:regulator of protease activity HflC (stomatin/prohibitin superfamily)
VTRIKAQAANTQADAEAYRVITAAKAQAQKLKIEAEAQAEATRLTAEAEANAVRTKAQADAEVIDQFAREMEMRRMEVARVRAFGSKTVFVPSEAAGAQMGNAMALGMAASLGAQASHSQTSQLTR